MRHTHHCRFYGENKKISNTLLYVNQFNVIVIFKPLTTVISSQEQKQMKIIIISKKSLCI
ncbi:hypothetical protein A9170_13310 [Staphylococcus epidermidis]|nr:hypothetical protein A9170_13310 [Staphylococcus epidermidis]